MKLECTPKEAADFMEELQNWLKEPEMALYEEDLEEIQEATETVPETYEGLTAAEADLMLSEARKRSPNRFSPVFISNGGSVYINGEKLQGVLKIWEEEKIGSIHTLHIVFDTDRICNMQKVPRSYEDDYCCK